MWISRTVAGAGEVWSSWGLTEHLSLFLYIRSLLQAFLTAPWPQGNWMTEDLKDVYPTFKSECFSQKGRFYDTFYDSTLESQQNCICYVMLVTSKSQISLDAIGGELNPTSWWGSNKVLGNTWDERYGCGPLWEMPSVPVLYCKDFRAQDV